MTQFAWIVYGRLFTEQISIMTLSASLEKSGIQPELIYSDSKSAILKEIGLVRPSVIGYSLMYGSHWHYRELSKAIRKNFPDIFQVIGGPLTTFYPEVIQDFSVDAVCVGEGDRSLVNLIKSLSAKGSAEGVRGFNVKLGSQVISQGLERLVDDLDSLPFPDRKLLYAKDDFLKEQEFKSFLSGRGCPYPCTYCFNHKFNEIYKGLGKLVRKKSVAYFIDEVARTKREFDCQFAIFEDDIFVLDRKWLGEFARKFPVKVGIPYICYVRADLVDEELLALLKESGCQIVRMAIETGNEQIRNTILKRNMSNQVIIDAAELIHRYGMKLSVSNMFGLPCETIDTVNETVQLNITCRPDNPTAQFFMPYPKMELTETAIEKGYFSRELFSRIPKNTWKFTPLLFEKKTRRFINRTQKIFTLIVRYPSLRRYARFFLMLPDSFLYITSIIVRTIITKNYLPPTKVRFLQRLRAAERLLRFYVFG